MTQVALLRHYPTEWNAQARLQGQNDIPLTAKARETLKLLKMPYPWDEARLFASPLLRAHETACLLADGRDIRSDLRLIEISWGEWEGVLAEELLADPASGFTPTHTWDRDTKAPNGESMRDAWDRVRPALAEIATDPTPAIIVTHKALMRVILGTACDWTTQPEIKRGRIYPVELRSTGLPRNPGSPARLEPRSA